MNAVILAAGLGMRLGWPHPKPLTPLAAGRTILRWQINDPQRRFGTSLHVTMVVGVKLEMFIEAVGADATFVRNEIFDQPNTSKSLLWALASRCRAAFFGSKAMWFSVPSCALRFGSTDHFESGIETAISESSLRFLAADISPFGSVEVDFMSDLKRTDLLTK